MEKSLFLEMLLGCRQVCWSWLAGGWWHLFPTLPAMAFFLDGLKSVIVQVFTP